jgi:hypothetical protein
MPFSTLFFLLMQKKSVLSLVHPPPPALVIKRLFLALEKPLNFFFFRANFFHLFLTNARKKGKIQKKSFFHAFYFFSRIFPTKQNFVFIKNKPLFSTYFFARAKKTRFITRASRTREKTVIFKKMREKIYFVFEEQIVIFLALFSNRLSQSYKGTSKSTPLVKKGQEGSISAWSLFCFLSQGNK